jgi:hypothetical protein
MAESHGAGVGGGWGGGYDAFLMRRRTWDIDGGELSFSLHKGSDGKSESPM